MYMIKVNFHQGNSNQKFIFSAYQGMKVYEFVEQVGRFFEVPVLIEFEGYQLHPDSYIGMFNNKELQVFPFEDELPASPELIIDLDQDSQESQATQIDPASLEPFDSANVGFIKIKPGQVIKFRLDLDGYYRALECGYDIQDEAIYEVTFVDQVKRLIMMDSGELVIGYENMIIISS